MRYFITLTLSVLAIALSLPALAAPTVSTTGYLQVRYSELFGAADTNKATGYFDKDNGTFQIRRARLAIKGTIDPQTSATIEIDGSKGAVETTKAFVAYTLHDCTIAAGRNTLPFTYEIQLSSTSMTTLERSMMARALSEYGVGLFITPQGAYIPCKLTAAIINGDDTMVDTNSNKLIVASAEYPAGTHLKLGASYLTGMNGHYGVNGYLVGQYGPIGAVAEYTQAEFTDKLAAMDGRNQGWYVLGTYDLNPTVRLHARYEAFDKAGAPETTYKTKHNIALGGTYFQSGNMKCTLEYQFIHDPANPALNNALGTQWQVRF